MVDFPSWRDKLIEARKLRARAKDGLANSDVVRLECAYIVAEICSDPRFIQWARTSRRRLYEMLEASGDDVDVLGFISMQLLVSEDLDIDGIE